MIAQGLDKGSTSKSKVLAASSNSPPAAPCVEVFEDGQGDEAARDNHQCRVAVTCVELNAIAIDDSDDRLPIGRKHEKNFLAVSRNISLPDEFSETRTKEEVEALDLDCGASEISRLETSSTMVQRDGSSRSLSSAAKVTMS